MKRNNKSIYNAIIFGYILLSPSLQASEATLDDFILETTSNSAYATTKSSEQYLSIYHHKSASQNPLGGVLVQQHIDPSHTSGSVYSYALASSNSFISSHFKIIALIKDLL